MTPIFNLLSAIIWDPQPNIFTIPIIEWPLKWYGLTWVFGFVLSRQILFYIFKKEQKPKADVDTLTIYIFIATIIGARFGHFLFYEPSAFINNPLQIILPPYAGLASHGAAIGILVGLFIFCRNRNYNYLWMLDRLAILVVLTGGFIRIGNLINSEIIGKPTDVPWAFIFKQVDNVPRHAGQLYEAIFCFIFFIILIDIWKNKKAIMYNGYIFGIFLIGLFTERFIVEFFKENQEKFEDQLTLNMGQILSIPFVIIGVLVLIYSYNKKEKSSLYRLPENAVG